MPATTKRSTVKKSATKKAAAKRAPAKRWSKHVMETSDAMDLPENIFKSTSAKRIATSLKKSAEASKRRKAEPFQSAMSMLNFYINRGGKNLPAKQLKILDDAKDELRKAFGKEEQD